jgi:Fe-S cluster assembly iron-binding protein IscA
VQLRSAVGTPGCSGFFASILIEAQQQEKEINVIQ